MMKTLILVLSLLGAAAQGVVEQNPTASPDSSMVAYTDGGNLFVRSASDTLQITSDGSSLILNGYASWVYYEEIFGRSSEYKAFWWSPDSRYLAFYRFDNSKVRLFPIYSASGDKGGTLNETRYPLCGDDNPVVQVGIADMHDGGKIVWADFDSSKDQYFGTPFWGKDCKTLFVQHEPRVQQNLTLFAVDASTGTASEIYSETYPTWLDWMEDMLFTDDGLYMVRSFETGWQQIYFLSYDGKTLRRLTSGENWRISLEAVDSRRGVVYYTSYTDSDVHACLYSVDGRGRQKLLSDPRFGVSLISLDVRARKALVKYENLNTAPFEAELDLRKYDVQSIGDGASELRKIIYCKMADGQEVPATVLLPDGFDPSKRYPLVMEIYGGPDTPYVRDMHVIGTYGMDRWFKENGIIKVYADSRSSGHNGRRGTDLVWRDLTTVPVEDFCTWAREFQSWDFVDPARIGVMGFSFGGTMTAMLVMRYPELFRCGIAGGGVYDWTLYDSHYTERFMDTPQRNPEGYERARVLSYVDEYDSDRSYLKITHGTGDDNVHFQNTLLLVDSLQRRGCQFDLMIYPDGMHGYRGVQGRHDRASDKIFWTERLVK